MRRLRRVGKDRDRDAGRRNESGSRGLPRRRRLHLSPVYKDVTLPAGTTLRLDLKSAVASDTSKVEDTVRAALRQAVVVDGQTVLPTGTELVGTVTDVERSGRVKGRARIAYRFSSLRHDSERYDIKTATIAHEAEPPRRRTRPRSRSAPGQEPHSVRFSAAEAAPRRAPRSAEAPAQAQSSPREGRGSPRSWRRRDDAIDRAAHGACEGLTSRAFHGLLDRARHRTRAIGRVQ